MMSAVLLRLAYLGVTNIFALLRLLPASDRDKVIEILALRHQIVVLERQLGQARPRFLPSDRAFLAALLHCLPWGRAGPVPSAGPAGHSAALAPESDSAPPRCPVTPEEPRRPRTVRSIRHLVLRLARENPSWG
jgi:putative transposase